MKSAGRVLGVLAIVAVLALIVWRWMVPQFFPATDPVASGGETAGARLASLATATGWINGGPSTADSLETTGLAQFFAAAAEAVAAVEAPSLVWPWA